MLQIRAQQDLHCDIFMLAKVKGGVCRAEFKVASVPSPLLRHFAGGVHPTAIHGRGHHRDAEVQQRALHAQCGSVSKNITSQKYELISLRVVPLKMHDLSLCLVSVSFPGKRLVPIGTVAVLK
jgi:hypothetical protein